MIAAWGLYYFPGGKPLTIIYLVAALLEKPIKVAPELAFDDNEVVLNSFPKKRYLWDDINNLILKDGLLTVDLKSNKLLQREVDADVSPADEKDFNDFCTAQLKRTAAN